MNLSMSLIASYLSSYDLHLYIQEDSCEIRGIRLFEDLQSYSKEYVYIGHARNYIQDKRFQEGVILASGKDQIICPHADYEAVLNDLLAAFEYYGKFEQQLHHAAIEHAPLTEFKKIVEDVIEDTLLIMNIEGTLLQSVHPQKMKVNGLNERQNNGLWGINSISQRFIDQDGNISHDLKNYPLYITIEGVSSSGAVTSYLVQGEERIGFILLFPQTELAIRRDLLLAEIMLPYLTDAEEFTSLTSPFRSNHAIMLQLIQAESSSPEILEKLERYLGFTSAPVLSTFKSKTVWNYTYKHMLGKRLEDRLDSCLCCEYQDQVLILTEEIQIPTMLNSLTEFLAVGNFRLGVSMPLPNLNMLRTGYEQATFALESSHLPGIYYCRDLAFSYMLQNLRDNAMSSNLLHPAIGVLKQYDSDNHTDLLQTLQIYIGTRFNQAETAASMHIHLNTLKYRLRRITEMTHIDLMDEEDLLYLQISLKL